MENRNNMGRGIYDAAVIDGLTDVAIKCWPYPKSNPDYLLSWTSLFVDSGNIDRANVVSSGLA